MSKLTFSDFMLMLIFAHVADEPVATIGRICIIIIVLFWLYTKGWAKKKETEKD